MGAHVMHYLLSIRMLTGMESGPFESAGITAYPSHDGWTAAAPGILATVLDRWELRVESAHVGGTAGSVTNVVTRDGSRAVLKVAFPHTEGIWEAVGLEAFPDGCAPRVLRQDPWTWAMLMDRVAPGTTLTDSGIALDDALAAAGELRVRLGAATPVDGIPRLTDVMRDYAALGRDRLVHQREALDSLRVADLVSSGIEELGELAARDTRTSLVHGDFNPGNILLDASGRLVVVDPKPLLGDPAFDLWPLISQLGDPYRANDPPATLARQATIAATAAQCDPAQVMRWSRARTALNVSWYLAENLREQATAEAAGLIAWNRAIAG